MRKIKELNEILNLRQSLNDIKIRMQELKEMTQPRSFTVSDMPRSGGERKNPIEEYAVKMEKLESKKRHIEGLITTKWNKIHAVMIEAGATEAQRRVIWYRFYKGLPWKDCAECMNEDYPDKKWGVQKLFRVYYKVIDKINKKKS